MWSGLWRKGLIPSQFNVRYSVYFKSAVCKMVNLFLIPWQDFSFSLIRYGLMHAEAGWVDLVIVFTCAVIEIDTHWHLSRSWIKFNSVAVKGAALYGAQCSGLSLGLLSAPVIKIISNKATADKSLVKVCYLNWPLWDLHHIFCLRFQGNLKDSFFCS